MTTASVVLKSAYYRGFCGAMAMRKHAQTAMSRSDVSAAQGSRTPAMPMPSPAAAPTPNMPNRDFTSPSNMPNRDFTAPSNMPNIDRMPSATPSAAPAVGNSLYDRMMGAAGDLTQRMDQVRDYQKSLSPEALRNMQPI